MHYDIDPDTTTDGKGTKKNLVPSKKDYRLVTYLYLKPMGSSVVLETLVMGQPTKTRQLLMKALKDKGTPKAFEMSQKTKKVKLDHLHHLVPRTIVGISELSYHPLEPSEGDPAPVRFQVNATEQTRSDFEIRVRSNNLTWYSPSISYTAIDAQIQSVQLSLNSNLTGHVGDAIL